MRTTVNDVSSQFTFQSLHPGDLCSVVGFAYDMAERVGQAVYVLAFEIDGRQLGDSVGDSGWGDRAIRLGGEDVVPRQFRYGRDAVLWRPHNRQWACDLIAGHWRESYIWWGMLADQRGIAEVANSVSSLWPHGYGNLGSLVHTVSPERKLVLLSCEGSYIEGRVVSDCWETARKVLAAIAGEALEVFEDVDAFREQVRKADSSPPSGQP